jgi:NAD(P)-dependent dehydrogenase (short-subunit alcohol dehydrogenase family)
VTHNSFLSRTSPEDIRTVIGTNIYGTILASRAAMISWLGNRGTDRVIINISSLLAFRGGIGASTYAASKAGVVGLTRALVDEGKTRGIRANVIVPGYIETDMTEGEWSLLLFACFLFVHILHYILQRQRKDRPPINAPAILDFRPPLIMAAQRL